MAKKLKGSKPGDDIRPAKPMTADSSELFYKVAEEVINGERELIDSLSEHERLQVIEWMTDAITDGNAFNSIHDVLWEVDYLRKPVAIDQFLNDEQYLGRTCAILHENWKRDLCTVFAPGSPISEWIMTGAIGIGKTSIAGVALAYKAYCMSCLKDPGGYYGLLPGDLIVFGIYSITKTQVADSAYFKMRQYLDSSPYFNQFFPRNRKLESRIEFTNHPLLVVAGSSEVDALGLNLFSFLMDEVNFMKAKTEKDGVTQTGQAYDLYNSTTARLTSRFSRAGGSLPGIALLLSSRDAQTSFLEERIEKSRGNKAVFISDYKLWECKEKARFATIWGMKPAPGTPPKFNVEIGDRVARSRILKPGETVRKGARTLEVPGELHTKFQEDIDQALRDLGGIATFNTSPLISDRQSLFDAVRTNLRHPFTRETITLDTQDDVLLQDFFDRKAALVVRESKHVPILNNGCPRFLHGDMSVTGDCFGLAMCHMSGFKQVRKEYPDGTTGISENPFILVDFMLQITPPLGSRIDFSKVRSFILFLKNFYNLEKVTFDQFQSEDMIQILEKQGLVAKKLSVDAEDTQYVTLRNAFYERRIAVYDYDVFQTEMLDLQRFLKEHKVDHPLKNSKGQKGSKDVADAVCGAVWNCLQSKTALKAAPVLGTTLEPSRVMDPGGTSNPTLVQSATGAPRIISSPAAVVAAKRLNGISFNELEANLNP